jgi:hypothetical protein
LGGPPDPARQSLSAPGTILFLDEIQATPAALPALRYLHEDYPELPVIAAGSLLEFVLAKHGFSMPVGRIQYYHLGPVTFDEYLAEVEPEGLVVLRACHPGDSVATAWHLRLVRRFREYLLVGGMPEALAAFAATREHQEALTVQRAILDTYQDDFAKYASGATLQRLHRIFQEVPRTGGRKIKYRSLAPDETARDVRQVIALLVKARLLTPVYHSHANGVPLSAEADPDTYKLLFLDTGLEWRPVASMQV